MKYKVAKELEDNKHIDSEVILYNNETLNKVLDKLNKVLIIYDTFTEKSAEKLSSVLVGNTTQITITGKNLFNKNNVTLGKRLSDTGTEFTDEKYFLSEYIEVEENTQYTKTPIFTNLYNRIGFYDSDKKLISMNDGENKATITTPEGTKYLRFGDLITNLDKEQLEKGSSATSYEPYTGGQPSPSPDYPQEIKSVTGKHKLNVAVGEETKAFDLDLGDLELNGIDTYKDTIDLVDNKWNINRQIAVERYSNTDNLNNNKYAKLDNSIYFVGKKEKAKTEKCYCNYLSYIIASKLWQEDNQGVSADKVNVGNPRIRISNNIATSVEEFNEWLKAHPLIIKWVPFNTTEEQITDTNLINQLNTILNYLISLELKGQEYTLTLEDVE